MWITAMPLYFFDIEQNSLPLHSSGAELANDREAWRHALDRLSETLREFAAPVSPDVTSEFLVRCGVGNSVFTLRITAEFHKH